MKQIIIPICLFFLFLINFSCKQDLTVKESSFCKSLEAGSFILDAPEGWWHWCMAPMYDEKGTVHVFMSAIPNSGKWNNESKIVHYTADKPEGPYTFVDTTFSSNIAAYHNPQISKVGDTYVMVYLWKLASTPGINQAIGIATTKSLDSAWTESPYNPIIAPSFEKGSPNALHASNPTFVADPDGNFRVYYKSISDKFKPKAYREISLAVSDNIEGPYVNHPDNPLISYVDKKIDIEDPYAFYYKGLYYMIVEDRMGVKNMLEGNAIPRKELKAGGYRPGLLYTSKDGIHWGRPEVGYQSNSFYFDVELARTERPHILWKNGEPDYLFLACHDEDPSAGFVLKIKDWK